MMVIGVFARADHPAGYGMCRGEPEGEARWHPQAEAHGYVVIVVQAENWIDLRAASERLSDWREPHFDPWDRGDDWYAGPYELVWAAEARPRQELDKSGFSINVGDRRSYGDNRAMAYLDAKEIIDL